MAELPTYFTDFLADIRLTDDQREALTNGHLLLRERLKRDPELSKIIINTYLQGSYRRSTIVRPKAKENADVDVIVVTELDSKDYDPPTDALKLFYSFLDRHYPKKWRIQGRSIGISLSEVDLDLVVTARPSETLKSLLISSELAAYEDLQSLFEEGKTRAPKLRAGISAMLGVKQESETLLIPDRDAGRWEETNPVAQLLWTWDMNASTSGHFVNVVKALKWWRRVHAPDSEHPKSYPLEHLIGDCCPEALGSVAEGVTLTLEEIVRRYANEVSQGIVPCFPDRGVDQNVFKRVTPRDFSEFYEAARIAAGMARVAFDEEDTTQSAKLWGKLFGSKFPSPPDSKDGGGDDGSGSEQGVYTKRSAPTILGGSGRFG